MSSPSSNDITSDVLRSYHTSGAAPPESCTTGNNQQQHHQHNAGSINNYNQGFPQNGNGFFYNPGMNNHHNGKGQGHYLSPYYSNFYNYVPHYGARMGPSPDTGKSTHGYQNSTNNVKTQKQKDKYGQQGTDSTTAAGDDILHERESCSGGCRVFLAVGLPLILVLVIAGVVIVSVGASCGWFGGGTSNESGDATSTADGGRSTAASGRKKREYEPASAEDRDACEAPAFECFLYKYDFPASEVYTMWGHKGDYISEDALEGNWSSMGIGNSYIDRRNAAAMNNPLTTVNMLSEEFVTWYIHEKKGLGLPKPDEEGSGRRDMTGVTAALENGWKFEFHEPDTRVVAAIRHARTELAELVRKKFYITAETLKKVPREKRERQEVRILAEETLEDFQSLGAVHRLGPLFRGEAQSMSTAGREEGQTTITVNEARRIKLDILPEADQAQFQLQMELARARGIREVDFSVFVLRRDKWMRDARPMHEAQLRALQDLSSAGGSLSKKVEKLYTSDSLAAS